MLFKEKLGGGVQNLENRYLYYIILEKIYNKNCDLDLIKWCRFRNNRNVYTVSAMHTLNNISEGALLKSLQDKCATTKSRYKFI